MLVEKLRKINITANQESAVGDSVRGEVLRAGPLLLLPCFRRTTLLSSPLLGPGRDQGEADRQWTHLQETSAGSTEEADSPFTWDFSLLKNRHIHCVVRLQAHSPFLTSKGPSHVTELYKEPPGLNLSF